MIRFLHILQIHLLPSHLLRRFLNIEIDFAVMKCEGSEFHNVLARYSNVFVPLDLLFGDGNCNNVGFTQIFLKMFWLK